MADIVLRALDVDTDRGTLATLFADDDTRLWNPGPSSDLAAWCARQNVPADDFRTWAVADPTDDRLLGVVSVFSVDAHNGTAEIGYRTVPAERGRGVATAAVRTAAQQAFSIFDGLQRIALFHAVENQGSCRVATGAGFELEATLRSSHVYGDGQRHDEHVHARLLDCVRRRSTRGRC